MKNSTSNDTAIYESLYGRAAARFAAFYHDLHHGSRPGGKRWHQIHGFVVGKGTATGPIGPQVSIISSMHNPHQGSPLTSWLFFEIAGVVIGAFFSGIISNRIALKIDRGFRITNKTRLLMAGFGGVLFGVGSQIARGCTSGSALSGMAVMSFGGILTMMAIFGSAYALAYLFRKFWI
jgi:hypothetical protein